MEDRGRYFYYLAQGYMAAGLYGRALEEGIKRKRVLKDAAFEPLWERPEFQLLVSAPTPAELAP